MQNNPERFCENCPCHTCLMNQSVEINGYENYQIFRDGRVYNKKRNIFMKQRNDKNGYKILNLSKDGKLKTLKIHRLVAINYIDNPHNKPQVDHINRIKYDNRIENLQWATSSENQQNKGFQINNTSGHKYISYNQARKTWMYQKTINGEMVKKLFKSKIDALCYKYIIQLKIRRKLF